MIKKEVAIRVCQLSGKGVRRGHLTSWWYLWRRGHGQKGYFWRLLHPILCATKPGLCAGIWEGGRVKVGPEALAGTHVAGSTQSFRLPSCLGPSLWQRTVDQAPVSYVKLSLTVVDTERPKSQCWQSQRWSGTHFLGHHWWETGQELLGFSHTWVPATPSRALPPHPVPS